MAHIDELREARRQELQRQRRLINSGRFITLVWTVIWRGCLALWRFASSPKSR